MCTVMSLFNGMSFGRMALETLGIPVAKYYSSEIDRYANQATEALFPGVIQLGDVTKWREWEVRLGDIDLLLAGFPCQAWSIAGKQKGDDDPRGALVHDLIDVWTYINRARKALGKEPVEFMFENVKMKKVFLEYINKLFGVEPVCINSALVSAQNRVRYYWTNIDGVEQPEDKGVVLVDILEFDLPSCGIGSRIVGGRLNDLGKREDYNHEIPISQYLGLRTDSKANWMTTVYKDSCVAIKKATERYKVRFKSKTVRVGGRDSPFGSKQEWDAPFRRVTKKLKVKPSVEKSACLTGGGHSGGNHSDMDMLVIEPDVCRRYSVRECFRLQTVPEHHIGTLLNSGISNAQLYKMCGNGWTHDVIVHLLKGSRYFPC